MQSNQWIDNPTTVREGERLKNGNLQRYLQEHLGNIEGELEIQQYPSGFSNLTYLIRFGDQEFVLRRPPFGANIKGGHDMGREYTILSKLNPVYPKAPRALLYCHDEEILGAPFYVMERVEGVILRAQMPAAMIPTPPIMTGIAHSLAETLAELHKVDYHLAGLSQLGRPEGYIERQVKGWIRRYSKAKTDDILEMDSVATWLDEQQPENHDATLVHNDFKYDNVVLHDSDWTVIKAVLDWEMCTLGDPMMDLGTSLGYWLDPNDPPELQALSLSPTTLPGNPSRTEFAQKYSQLSGRSLDQVVFYYVFGLYKIAVIIQQIYARYKLGHTKDKRFAGLIHGVRGCSLLAARAIEKNRIGDLF